MALNARESRVLLILALILTSGGGVRLISAHRPHWTPGVVVGQGETVDDRTQPEVVPYGSGGDRDSLFVEGRMDLNAAGEQHLVLLPRIGPALAERIVAWRDEHGRFGRVDDLIHIRGIGPKTLEQLRPHVCVR